MKHSKWRFATTKWKQNKTEVPDLIGDELKGKVRTLGPGTAICDTRRGYLEVSLRLLLLGGQLRQRVLQRLRLGRVKLPLLLQRSGPLLILLHPGARHSKGGQPFPPQHNSQEERGLSIMVGHGTGCPDQSGTNGSSVCVALQWHRPRWRNQVDGFFNGTFSAPRRSPGAPNTSYAQVREHQMDSCALALTWKE